MVNGGQLDHPNQTIQFVNNALLVKGSHRRKKVTKLRTLSVPALAPPHRALERGQFRFW